MNSSSSSRVIAVVVVAVNVDVVVVSLYVCSSCCYSLRSLLFASLSLSVCCVSAAAAAVVSVHVCEWQKGRSISILCAERSIDDNIT